MNAKRRLLVNAQTADVRTHGAVTSAAVVVICYT